MCRTLKQTVSLGRWPLAVVSLCAIGAIAVPGEEVAAQAGSCQVTTALGDVVGARRGGVCVYLGVPYAASPMGTLRWRPPQPRAPWSPSVLNAATAPVCPQINVATGALSGSEDCLTLNIWAPTHRQPPGVPVMVWLHTGGFQAASASFPASDGQRFAEERNALVVAPNYRLGPFGYLAHSALSLEDASYPTSGNYGLADQRAAVRWVRDNIAAFGGNPENVTLAGTSAGALSVTLLLVSPVSRGMFHRAIIQSGYATPRLATSAEANVQGEAFVTALGCAEAGSVVSCMKAASRDQVLRALPIGQAQFLEEQGRAQWGPVVDGVEIPDQPRELLRLGRFPRVPVIVGTNGDEGWTFVDRSFPGGLDSQQYERVVRGEFGMDADIILQTYPARAFPTAKDALARLTADVEFVCEARRLARALHKEGAPVYRYSFEYAVDEVTPSRAFHGLESNLLFGNNFGAPTPHTLTPADLVVFNAMSSYWRRFMETGDPNPLGVPVQWPSYRPGPFEEPVDSSRSDRYFVFADRLGISTYLRDQQCNFWEPFFFRSVRGAIPAAAR